MVKPSYDEQNFVGKDLRFQSPSGLIVETTGKSEPMYGNNGFYRHEVVITEGPKKGEKFFAVLSTYRPVNFWSWD